MIDKDRQELVRGNQATEVLNNPIYQEAFTAIRAKLMDEFQKTKFRQSKLRDEIWRQMKSVDQVQKHLEQVMRSGQISEATIARRSKKLVRGI